MALRTRARRRVAGMAYALAWRFLSRIVGRPIFILSAPRSGSTFLFECLARLDGLVHLPREADDLWWRTFPYGPDNQFSDLVPADKASPEAVRRVGVDLYGAALISSARRGRLRRGRGSPPLRYLDKTIAHCFHLGFLREAFPDAQYLLLVRDPRAVVSSMMEGWRQPGRFTKPRLRAVIERCRDARVEQWCYPAPPGWADVLTMPLQQICAWSWKQHIEHVLRHFRSDLEDVVVVRYEDLANDSVGTVSTLASRLGLQMSEAAVRFARSPDLSWSTVSPPRSGKWQEIHGAAIADVVPLVRGLAAQLGYEV